MFVCGQDRYHGGGGTGNTDTPKLVTAIPEKIVQISLGAEFSLALDAKGNVWAWGTNSDGQCGPGHFTTVNEPTCILKGTVFIQL